MVKQQLWYLLGEFLDSQPCGSLESVSADAWLGGLRVRISHKVIGRDCISRIQRLRFLNQAFAFLMLVRAEKSLNLILFMVLM